MRKVFILTGEPSGDKLASKVISKLMAQNPNIEYLSVSGSHIKKLGIQSIFDLKEITYLGFTSVILNIFKIRNRINKTVDEILKFNPDILFSVDSPDFTLRVAERVKKKNKNIKTIHYVAPQVWVWRKNRVKKIKKFIDHMLLLFNFEKKYFDQENIKTTFVGHPLIETNQNVKTVLNDLISKDKKIISIFHATEDNKDYIFNQVNNSGLDNIDVVSDDNIKSQILCNSIFAVSKSGTVSLQIASSNIPSIIIYKLNYINFMIFKLLVNVKFANIINIINDKEVIPELLQDECNAKEIFNTVIYFLKNPDLIKKQLSDCNKTLEGIRSKTSSSNESASILSKYLAF